MTTYVQARDTLVGVIDSAWVTDHPGVDIFYENTVRVDVNTVSPLFVKVDLNFNDASQYDIDLIDPSHDVIGELSLTIMVKEGTGVRAKLTMMDYLTGMYKLKVMGGVQTMVPTPGRKTARDGWAGEEIVVPFSFNSKY